MKRYYSIAVLAGLASAIVFSGCTANTNWSKSPGLLNSAKPNASAVPAPAQPVSQSAPQTSYVLSAEAAGQYIAFKIYNMGSSDLAVKKEDFALVSTGNQSSRGIIPYNAQTCIIDIPQDAVLKPNDSLQGRAMFKDVPDPVGRRLVFKPDAMGTFADIQPFQPK